MIISDYLFLCNCRVDLGLEFVIQISVVFFIVGVWVGVFFILFDWDRDWQVLVVLSYICVKLFVFKMNKEILEED